MASWDRIWLVCQVMTAATPIANNKVLFIMIVCSLLADSAVASNACFELFAPLFYLLLGPGIAIALHVLMKLEMFIFVQRKFIHEAGMLITM